MTPFSTRRHFLASVAAGAPALALAPAPRPDAGQPGPVTTAALAAGDLRAVLRDNSRSPKVLSGLAPLRHRRDAPAFDAFDPDSPGASAGLNFEHLTCGHRNAHNAFSPRHGTFTLRPLPGGTAAVLVRRREDDPWSVSCALRYTATPPHYVDVDFRCTPHDPALFGRRGYAALFFANYLNDVEDAALHFRGVEGPGGPEKWITADAPEGHPDWNRGGTYRHAAAADLGYDAGHDFRLNLWSYDYPRFTRPFYYGRAANGMAFLLLLGKAHTAEDEVRFSLFKFKLPRRPRPAWDFQYVLRGPRRGREYGFKARLAWKRFVSPDDCLREYESWAGPAP